MPEKLRVGDLVRVFYRASRENGYFIPIRSVFATRTPRIGLSHGWQDAVVLAPKAIGAPHCVCVRYVHQRWVSRSGEVLDVRGEEGDRTLTDVVHKSRVRFAARGAHSDASAGDGACGDSAHDADGGDEGEGLRQRPYGDDGAALVEHMRARAYSRR